MKTFRYMALLLPLMLFGCIEDNSSYGGIELDEITVEGIASRYEIELGSNFRISPTVTAKSGNTDKLSYVWYKYNSSQIVPDTLSFEKDLDVVIDDVMPGIENTLSFKVTDDETGIIFLYKTTFTTVAHFSGGTLMLCRDGSEYSLALLKKDGTTLYEDIYATENNGEKLPAASKHLFLINGYAKNPDVFKAIVVASADASGGLYIDPDFITKKSTMREKFSYPDDMPPVIDITHYVNDQSNDYLIINGLLYARPYDANTNGEWYSSIVVLSEPTDYYLTPYCVHYSSYPLYGVPVYYDNIHGRMMYPSGGFFSSFAGPNHEFVVFDPNKLGEGVEMVMCGNWNSSPNYDWALMKDTDGSYFLITYYVRFNSDWSYNFVTESMTPLPKSDLPALYTMTAFVPGTKQKVDTISPFGTYTSGESGFFFFVSDNKVYAFNVLTASYGMLIDGAEENYNITGVNCTEMSAPTDDDPNAKFNQLTLAVQNMSTGSKSGGIVVYRLGNIGGLTATKLYEKTGFCDEVVSMVEKID